MARPPATALNVDPLLLGLVVLAVAAWFWVIRRSNESPSGSRQLALGAAVTLLIAIWISPLATLAQHYLLAAHLIQVLILMGPVPALLLLALPRNAGIYLHCSARASAPRIRRLVRANCRPERRK